MGRLADLYGRKHVFLLGVAFIGIFSLGAGFAQDEITLDVLRGIQGIGGAAVIPASLGILAHSFPPSRTRSIAFATFAAGAPMGGAIGNIIGGALTQLTKPTWRSSFFLVAGLSLGAFVGGVASIDKDVPYEGIDRRVDWIGAFLVTAGLVFIVFALSDGPIAPEEFKTSYIIALLVVGFVLLVAFIFWQRYLERVHEHSEDTQNWWTPPPLMKVTVWTRSNWRMAVILWIAFFEWSSFQAWQFWAQVRVPLHSLCAFLLTKIILALLSKLSQPVTCPHHDSVRSHVCHWMYLQCYRRHLCWPSSRRLPHCPWYRRDRLCRTSIRRYQHFLTLLGFWIPVIRHLCFRRRLCICLWHALRREDLFAARTVADRCSLPNHDSARNVVWSGNYDDHLQLDVEEGEREIRCRGE